MLHLHTAFWATVSNHLSFLLIKRTSSIRTMSEDQRPTRGKKADSIKNSNDERIFFLHLKRKCRDSFQTTVSGYDSTLRFSKTSSKIEEVPKVFGAQPDETLFRLSPPRRQRADLLDWFYSLTDRSATFLHHGVSPPGESRAVV
jgi:hypothetical protein